MGLIGLLGESFVVVAVDDFLAVAKTNLTVGSTSVADGKTSLTVGSTSVADGMPVVHAVAEAVAEGFAVFAHTTACPTAVAEGLETGLPHLPKVVVVDVALGEGVAVDVGAGADGAVDEDGSDVDACMAEVGILAHAALVTTQIAFAAEGDGHECLIV